MNIYEVLSEYNIQANNLKPLNNKIYKKIKKYYCTETYMFTQYSVDELDTWFHYIEVENLEEGWLWRLYKNYKTHNKLSDRLHKHTKFNKNTYYSIDGNNIIVYTFDETPTVYISRYSKKLTRKVGY